MNQTCISCNLEGHTYLECPSIPFAALFCQSIGAPDFLGPSRQQLAEELAKAERRRQYNELRAEFEGEAATDRPIG